MSLSQKASMKLSAQNSRLRREKLGEAIHEMQEENEERMRDLAKAHAVTFEHVKKVMTFAPEHQSQNKISAYNALLHRVAIIENESTWSCLLSVALVSHRCLQSARRKGGRK
jgi:hypothetical protein